MNDELLDEVMEYITYTEVALDAEFGAGRTWEELLERGKLYNDGVALFMKLANEKRWNKVLDL